MKKMTKILAGLGVLLLVAGLVLSGAGMVMGAQTNLTANWFGVPVNVGVGGIGVRRSTNWETAPNTKIDTQEMSLEPFEKLEVDVDLGDVTVESATDYGVALFSDTDGYELRYELEDGTLRIWSEDRANIHLGSGISASVQVCVPQGVKLDKVNVETDLGDCVIRDMEIGKLDVEAKLGAVYLSGLTVGEADLELSLGSLDIRDMAARELEADLSLGDLTGEGLTVSRELKVENSMGAVDLTGEFLGTVELTDNMGSVELFIVRPESDYSYDLKTSMGSVRVNGEEYGDKTARPGGGNMLTIRNSMGDIDVTFGG